MLDNPSKRCGCAAGHATFGACLRAKNLQIADVDAHLSNATVHNEIKAYHRAREAGLQPATTRKNDVDAAWRATDATGTPYRADV